MATDCLMTMEFSRFESVVSVGNSSSGWCWKYFPRGFEVRGDQEMWEKSNAKVSKTKSERLESYLVLGKVSPNSSLQCLDISLTETTSSAGKERFLTNLCSLLSLSIKLSVLNISWKDFASVFLLVWVLLADSIFQWSHLQNLCGVSRACTTNMCP